MKLRKVDWVFAAFVFVVVVGVSLLPTPKDRNPVVPKNVEHQAITVENACSTCHQAGAAKPLPDRHPKRQDCFRCHAR